MICQAAQLAGYMLRVIAAISPRLAVAIDAGTFAASALLLSRMGAWQVISSFAATATVIACNGLFLFRTDTFPGAAL